MLTLKHTTAHGIEHGFPIETWSYQGPGSKHDDGTTAAEGLAVFRDGTRTFFPAKEQLEIAEILNGTGKVVAFYRL